jgi:hypothetical protein
MNKFLLSLVAILLVGGISASAQRTASSNAQCTTVVVRALSIEKNQDLDFGIQAQGAGEVTIPTTDQRAVKFTVRGEDFMEVLMTFSAPSALINSNGDKLPFTAYVTNNSKDNAESASELKSGSTQNLNDEGYQYVYLGGAVNVATDQARGFYTGQFDLNVEYTF